jgi:peptidyl-prolyl cis-trans isomerase SurA
LYRKNHQNPSEDYTREKIEEYLQLYINFKLKVEEARHRGLDTTSAFKKEFNQYKEELRRPYLPGNGLTDSLVRLTYERMKEELHVAHILISLKPDATPQDTLNAYNRIVELRERAVSGEKFEELAATFSEDPSAKMNQGDLGYFTALQMVYPFENAAYNTPVGEISQPVRTRFGYHILNVYERRPAREEVEVAHIMIRTGEQTDNDVAKNRIFSVHEQLQAGRDWNELCKEYSEDPGSRESGGKLRPFRPGQMSNVPEFERVALELNQPKQFSDPFQTQYGWHIVRLERKLPLAPFAEMAASLKNRVSRDERTQISKQALQKRLRADFGLSENTTTKNQLFNLPDSSIRSGSVTAVDGELGSAELFQLAGKSYLVSSLFDYLGREVAASQRSSRNLPMLYEQYIDETILRLQEETVLQAHPEYRFLLNEYYEGILLFEIMEKEVWNKASEDSTGQHRYFLKNKARYTAGPRVKASLYSTPDKSVIPALADLIREENTRDLQTFVARNKVRVESGYFTSDEKAILGKVPTDVGIHQGENNGMYYIAWLKEILPAGEMSFEEARPSIISDYQNFLEAEWLSELNRKYPVRLNAAGKKQIIKVLENK